MKSLYYSLHVTFIKSVGAGGSTLPAENNKVGGNYRMFARRGETYSAQRAL